jgi:hypothetical protein
MRLSDARLRTRSCPVLTHPYACKPGFWRLCQQGNGSGQRGSLCLVHLKQLNRLRRRQAAGLSVDAVDLWRLTWNPLS